LGKVRWGEVSGSGGDRRGFDPEEPSEGERALLIEGIGTAGRSPEPDRGNRRGRWSGRTMGIRDTGRVSGIVSVMITRLDAEVVEK